MSRKLHGIRRLAALALALVLLCPSALAKVSTNYTLTGNQAADIVAVAKAQVGKTKSDFGWAKDWCAYFVCWAGRTAKAAFPSSDLGTPLDVAQWFVNSDKGVFYCFRDGNYNSLISAGVSNKDNIVRTSRSSFTPRQGDLVVYLWSTDVGRYNWSHIGIVDSFSGQTLRTVEGNTSGGVVANCTRSYDSQVVGIIRPNYAKSGGSTGGSTSGVSLSLKQSNFTLDVGDKATLEFTFTGTIGSVSQQIGNSGICKYVTGEWKQSTHWGSMTFQALAPGNTTITILLYDKSGKLITSKSANITVRGNSVSLSCSTGSVSIEPGQTRQVTFHFSGDGIARASCGTTNGSVCNATLPSVDWSKGVATVALQGKQPGSCTAYLILVDSKGNTLARENVSVTVNNYSVSLSAATGSLSLDLASRPTGQVTLQIQGSYPSGCSMSLEYSNSSVASAGLAALSDGRISSTITAKQAGSTTITYYIYDQSGKRLASDTVQVQVSAPTYTVRYDANGGSGAPGDQTKTYQQGLTLRTVTPSRAGYVFNGWATSPTATSAQYQPGARYTMDQSVTLYAVWAPATDTPYRVNHYQQTPDGSYILKESDTLYGTTGSTVTPQPKHYEGFITPAVQSGKVPSTANSTVVIYYYNLQSYDLTLIPGEGVQSVQGGGRYLYGTYVTVSATLLQGYQWTGWQSDSALCPDSSRQSYSFTMPAGDVTLTAAAVWQLEDSTGQTPAEDPDDTTQQPPQEEDPCAQGHTWGGWRTTVPAGCETPGSQARTCQVCGQKETRDIPAAGHDYRATRTDEGTLYTCTVCGDQYLVPKQDTDPQPEPEPEPDPEPDPDAQGLENFTQVNQYYAGMFRDVRQSDWYLDNVQAAYELGLMRGTGSGVFSPQNNITLAEAVTLAARLHSIYYYGSEQFTSYDGGNWYDPYVNYAREEGILYENYEYSRPATREQFVHILAQALPPEALPDLRGGAIDFADGNDIIYQGDIDLLTRAGVINGIPSGRQTLFLPGNTITRAEVAAIVTRMARPELRAV